MHNFTKVYYTGLHVDMYVAVWQATLVAVRQLLYTLLYVRHLVLKIDAPRDLRPSLHIQAAILACTADSPNSSQFVFCVLYNTLVNNLCSSNRDQQCLSSRTYQRRRGTTCISAAYLPKSPYASVTSHLFHSSGLSPQNPYLRRSSL